jgi:reactive chlorine resistance protein C
MAARMENMERANVNGWGYTLENIGAYVIRYGLVIVLLWVGALKFTAYEAEGIQGLVANSPLMSWMLGIMSVQAVAMLIGIVEIILGLLIAARPFAPQISAIGSLGAIVMFLITLSFALTTPGVWQPGYGFPFPSPMPGQFLAKDLLFLGAAIWTAGEALRAAGWRNSRTDTSGAS